MAERNEDYPLPTRPAATANRSRAAQKAPVPSIPAPMMSAFLNRSEDKAWVLIVLPVVSLRVLQFSSSAFV
jgi:hypothetical protein